MNTVVIAIISVAAIGAVCAVLLAVASKVMYVKTDERIAKLRACLPGANCGACGFSGCDGYAVAIASGEAEPTLCPPGGDAAYKQISEVLGISAGEGVTKKVATVHCLGDLNTACNKMEYAGIDTCFAVKQLYGGQGACTFGCVGYGDCVSVCPVGAICIEDNLARIDRRKCTGCGLCVKACPAGVISVETEPVHVAVLCKNTEKGAKLKGKCSKGCIGCMKCVKECPCEAITVSESLATIDYNKCTGCGKCVGVCVKKCIALYQVEN